MEKEFPIKLITRKSHWLEEFVLVLFIIGFLGLFIFYISMSPSKNSTVELQTLWFIEGVPLWIKQLTLWGIIFLGFAIVIELINRRSKTGILIVKENLIEIFTKKRTLQLPFDEIKEIAFVSPFGSSSYKIFFKLREGKIISLKLSDYSTLSELTDCLSSLVNKDVKIIADMSNPYWPSS